MSQQFPPGLPPIGYYGSPPVMPWRPTAVTVLAIIGIIFGVIAVICGPIGTFMLFVKFPGSNAALAAQRNDPTIMMWFVGSTIYQFGIGIVLLAGSIGSLSMKRWARKAMVIYAFVTIVAAVISTTASVAWLTPRLERAQRQAGVPPPPPFLNPRVGTIGGFLLGVIFPVCVAYFFTRPEIKAAFDRAGGAAGDVGPASARYTPDVFPPPPPDGGGGPVI